MVTRIELSLAAQLEPGLSRVSQRGSNTGLCSATLPRPIGHAQAPLREQTRDSGIVLLYMRRQNAPRRESFRPCLRNLTGRFRDRHF